MCFSPEASFTLSAALAVSAGYCVHRARALDRELLPLAVIPGLFAVQQFCEGWVWVGLTRGDPALTRAGALGFLVFALVVWPVWIPYAAMRAERSREVRWFLRGMLALGLGLGVGLMVPALLEPGWLALRVSHHSLHYSISRSPVSARVPPLAWQLAYMLVVSTPLLVSSSRRLVHLGVAVVLSAAATHVFFSLAFASVWCFVAAALSLYLCGVFARAPVRVVRGEA